MIDEILIPDIDTYVGDLKSVLLAFGHFGPGSRTLLDSLGSEQLAKLTPVDRFIKVLNLQTKMLFSITFGSSFDTKVIENNSGYPMQLRQLHESVLMNLSHYGTLTYIHLDQREEQRGWHTFRWCRIYGIVEVSVVGC